MTRTYEFTRVSPQRDLGDLPGVTLEAFAYNMGLGSNGVRNRLFSGGFLARVNRHQLPIAIGKEIVLGIRAAIMLAQEYRGRRAAAYVEDLMIAETKIEADRAVRELRASMKAAGPSPGSPPELGPMSVVLKQSDKVLSLFADVMQLGAAMDRATPPCQKRKKSKKSVPRQFSHAQSCGSN